MKTPREEAQQILLKHNPLKNVSGNPEYFQEEILDAMLEFSEKQKIEFAIEKLKPYLEWNDEVAAEIQKDIDKLQTKLNEQIK